MVKIRFLLRTAVIFIIILTFTLSPIVVMAQKPLVFDDAILFSEEEKLQLDAKVNDLSDIYHMDIVIVTTEDAGGKTSREYADDYFDYGNFGVGENYDGILFLIDMDNREAYISTSGIGIRYLTDERIESVLDRVFDNGLSEGDYYGATVGFLQGIEIFLERGIPSNQYSEPEKVYEPNRITTVDLIISIVGGATVGSIFYFVTKSKYKGANPNKQYSYKKNSGINLTTREDRLVKTFVTHRVLPKPQDTSKSSSGGRSTTHKSSSGRSHGGGGRKF